MERYGKEQISTADGQRIVGRFYAPPESPIGGVRIVPARGVQQSFCASLADWLATKGFLAATFDFRGIGLSRIGSLRNFRANIFDWARLDCVSMIEALMRQAGDLPIFWIGTVWAGRFFRWFRILDA